jgi:hypothetical protein
VQQDKAVRNLGREQCTSFLAPCQAERDPGRARRRNGSRSTAPDRAASGTRGTCTGAGERLSTPSMARLFGPPPRGDTHWPRYPRARPPLSRRWRHARLPPRRSGRRAEAAKAADAADAHRLLATGMAVWPRHPAWPPRIATWHGHPIAASSPPGMATWHRHGRGAIGRISRGRACAAARCGRLARNKRASSAPW